MFASQHSVTRADAVERRLLDRVASLSDLPRQGRPVALGMRQLSLPDVQLIVRYRIVEDDNVIRIVRVLHTRENRDQP